MGWCRFGHHPLVRGCAVVASAASDHGAWRGAAHAVWRCVSICLFEYSLVGLGIAVLSFPSACACVSQEARRPRTDDIGGVRIALRVASHQVIEWAHARNGRPLPLPHDSIGNPRAEHSTGI